MSLSTSLNILGKYTKYQNFNQSRISYRAISLSKQSLTPFKEHEQFFEPVLVPEYPPSAISVLAEDADVTYTDFFKERIRKYQEVRHLVAGNMTVGQKILAQHSANPSDVHSKQFWVTPSRVALSGVNGVNALHQYCNPILMSEGMNTNVSMVKEQYRDVQLNKQVVVPTSLHVRSKGELADVLSLCREANIGVWTGSHSVGSVVSQHYALPGMLIASSTDTVLGGPAALGAFVLNVSSTEAAGVMHGQPLPLQQTDPPIQIHITNQLKQWVGVQDVVAYILHALSYFAADITYRNTLFLEIYDCDNNLSTSQLTEISAALQTLPSVTGVIVLNNATAMNFLRDSNRGVLADIFGSYGSFSQKQDVLGRVHEVIKVDLAKVQARASVYQGAAGLGGITEVLATYHTKTSTFIQERHRHDIDSLKLNFHLLPEHCNAVVVAGGVTELTQALQLLLECKKKKVSLQVPLFLVPDCATTKYAVDKYVQRVKDMPNLTILPPQDVDYKTLAPYLEKLVLNHRARYPQTDLHRIRHNSFFGKEYRYQLKQQLDKKSEVNTVCQFTEKSAEEVAKRLRVVLGMDETTDEDQKKYLRSQTASSSSEEEKQMIRNDRKQIAGLREKRLAAAAADAKPVHFTTDSAVIASSFILVTNSITYCKDKQQHFEENAADVCLYLNTQHAVCSAVHNALGLNMAEYQVLSDQGEAVYLKCPSPYVSPSVPGEGKEFSGLSELPSTVPLASYQFDKNDTVHTVPKTASHRVLIPAKAHELDLLDQAECRQAVSVFRLAPQNAQNVYVHAFGVSNEALDKLVVRRADKMESAANTLMHSAREAKLPKIERTDIAEGYQAQNVLFPHYRLSGYVDPSVNNNTVSPSSSQTYNRSWWDKQDYVGLDIIQVNENSYDFLSSLHYPLKNAKKEQFYSRIESLKGAPFAQFLGDLGATLTYDMQDFEEGGVDATTMTVSSTVASILAKYNCKVVIGREMHNNLARALKAHGIITQNCLNQTEICSFVQPDDKVSVMQMEGNLLPQKMPEVVLHTFKDSATVQKREVEDLLLKAVRREIAEKGGDLDIARGYSTVEDVEQHKKRMQTDIALREAFSLQDGRVLEDGQYEHALSDVLKSQYTDDARTMLSALPESLRKSLAKVKGNSSKANEGHTNMRIKCTLPMETTDLVWFRCGGIVNAGAE